MLPLPNLDDKSFKELVDEARKLISKYAPQWTDENYHDPGITFIELFAWLTELQQYYLNRVTEKNELKFLKLLGIEPQSASVAKAMVHFQGVSKFAVLPKGLPLSAGELPFETGESLNLIPSKLEKIVVSYGDDFFDYSSAKRMSAMGFYAFGEKAKKGSSLYLGFDRELPDNTEITFTFNLADDYPVARVPLKEGFDGFVQTVALNWRYSSSDAGSQGSAVEWKPLTVLKDETCCLTTSGRITFKLPTEIKPSKIRKSDRETYYWISCCLEEQGYELSPRVKEIQLNNTLVYQQKTIIEYKDFTADNIDGAVLEIESYAAYYGKNEVYISVGNGLWKQLEVIDGTEDNMHSIACDIIKDEYNKKIKLAFRVTGTVKNNTVEKKSIRVISFLPEYEQACYIGISKRLPDQFFRIRELPGIQDIVEESFALQIGCRLPGETHYVWQDWNRVRNFDNSKPSDLHFVLNPQEREILFGNNENGSIPGEYADNRIRIISCRMGGGEDGNVKEGEIKSILGKTDEVLTLTNLLPAAGGGERESIEAAKLRLRRSMKKQHRAVTCEDYEEIAKSTPGLRVARVKAIPLFEPGLKNYPDNKVPAQVTLVAVPYSEAKQPLPSKGFLETVGRHLEEYRLVTTKVNVIPPEYVKITVHAVVVVAPHIKFNTKVAADALNQLLNPIGKNSGQDGWPFGKSVHKGDIFQVINKIPGVEYIRDLRLDAEGPGVRRDAGGDIHIPPHCLVYSGEHDIEAISSYDI